ncbi:MAG: putative sulfate/molybdate transporter [Blastocatellia bacterium]|nr:putative sulfate/molybdate transporter [Blastocatellia bacterium]MCS7157459.1 putative sulfate/molybdate transporter [Blastocatellia bacterium]MCX7752632.1 putative sulfate/molybdate transporter [Blastocatellia bacterium]MDW8255559.1 putative sulfate/molybdate transporter [Acidobacteriota bacterium]
METIATAKSKAFPIRFDRNEWAGAFGDLGTDFPLVVGVTLAAQLDSASVLTMFGLMQILTGWRYRLPMPVQPLKAMAAIVITQKLSGSVLYGAGLAIGVIMLLLSLSGLIEWLTRVIPKSVVRGIQFGLGLQLAMLALREYVPADGFFGYALAIVGFALTLILLGNRRYPVALLLVLMGFAYSLAFKISPSALVQGVGFSAPKFHLPQWSDIWTGVLLLALPQIPLSLGNSILATRQIVEDLFPERRITARQLSLTYALMNVVNPFFGGIPTCHGSGGVAGHYTFGARTGGSVIIEGALYLLLGLFFGRGFDAIVKIFPLPILGVILFFEGVALLRLVGEATSSRSDWMIILLVGLLAVGLPYGYLMGMFVGVVLAILMKRGLVAVEAKRP